MKYVKIPLNEDLHKRLYENAERLNTSVPELTKAFYESLDDHEVELIPSKIRFLQPTGTEARP